MDEVVVNRGMIKQREVRSTCTKFELHFNFKSRLLKEGGLAKAGPPGRSSVFFVSLP